LRLSDHCRRREFGDLPRSLAAPSRGGNGGVS
jgi:hypothetical protein